MSKKRGLHNRGPPLFPCPDTSLFWLILAPVVLCLYIPSCTARRLPCENVNCRLPFTYHSGKKGPYSTNPKAACMGWRDCLSIILRLKCYFYEHPLFFRDDRFPFRQLARGGEATISAPSTSFLTVCKCQAWKSIVLYYFGTD